MTKWHRQPSELGADNELYLDTTRGRFHIVKRMGSWNKNTEGTETYWDIYLTEPGKTAVFVQSYPIRAAAKYQVERWPGKLLKRVRDMEPRC